METYAHNEFCLSMAEKLKAVSHSEDRKRFFTAFGLEDLYNLEDRMSGLTGMVLIAVDGSEVDYTDNRAQGISRSRAYAIILATNARHDDPKSIDAAADECRRNMEQVRHALLGMFESRRVCGQLEPEMELTGIGPIGDSYYGVVLSFRVTDYPDYAVDESYFHPEG